MNRRRENMRMLRALRPQKGAKISERKEKNTTINKISMKKKKKDTNFE